MMVELDMYNIKWDFGENPWEGMGQSVPGEGG